MSVQPNIGAAPAPAVPSVPAPPAPQSMWKELFRYRDNRVGVWLIVPSLLALIVVQFYPIVYTFWLILTSEKGEFLGLGNLTRLTTDTIFRGALVFSLKMGIVVVPLCLLVGLGLAMVVHSDFAKNKAIWISILIVPLMVSEIVAGMMWKILYHPTLGLVNLPLTAVGLEPIVWLQKGDTAFIALCIVEIWRISPLAFLLLYAGLNQVPRDIYEAAAVDGATRWRAFWDMTLPYIRPMFAISTILVFVWSTRTIGTIAATTQGGPGRATWNLSWFIYGMFFQRLRPHYASAAVLVMLLMTYIAGTLFVKYLWVERRSR
ncbi:MAG: sugar ABC transporter permease [Caldilineaceae bacterium]|nr:sugar ABC transporter permease [Caldilineaceae bacterium]MCY4093256.1 sugar ABC transporter permease [Caldilineaceae bacterium]MCY4117202.1 sugar ABC transporter permease [Caldilineaceae bacterium]MDE0070114.1 sugar ABC transporter permease [Caldilineaceae bacterium]